MDDSQVLLQVLNNIIQRNAKRVQDYEIEIANYMTTLIRLENKISVLEEKNNALELLKSSSRDGEDKK